MAILVLILGIVLIYLGIQLYYGCSVIDGIITTPNWIKTNLPYIDRKYPAINYGSTACAYQNSPGDLINALGYDTTGLDRAYGVYGVSAFYQGVQPLLNAPVPPVGGTIAGGIAEHIQFTNVPRDNPANLDITEAA